MRTASIKNAFVLSSLLAVAGIAGAQTAATGTVGGQASTQSATGVPNPTQRPEAGAMPNTRAEVKAGARTQAGMPNTTNVPSGQASTKFEGQPNRTAPPNERSRAAVRNEAKMEAQMSGNSRDPKVPTNPNDKREGTPK